MVIAIDCITQDRLCVHAQCGDALLGYQRRRARKISNRSSNSTSIEIMDDATLQPTPSPRRSSSSTAWVC
ncbi:hypothetical protein BD414DRAFT_478159 [Trametes punicea]|nr:hypothetical protein BD414DRAFT_478159 [Trametes punicea]